MYNALEQREIQPINSYKKNVISKAITKLGWGDKLLELIVNGALRGKMSPALNGTGVDTSGMDTANK